MAVVMISILVHLSNIRTVRGTGGAAGRGGTVLLSRTKNGGKDSRAARIITFMIIRNETTGNAESTYHVENHKTQTPDPACSHHRRRDRIVLQVMTKMPTGTWVGTSDVVCAEKQMQWS